MSDKVNYTTDDIRRYLEGRMSAGEMHALEKAALSDPFLADALEGMEIHGDRQKFNSDVEDLREKLAGKSKMRSGAFGSFYSLWWKIAAILIIVVTGVAIIVFTGKNEESSQNQFAKTEESTINYDSSVTRNNSVVKPQAAVPESTKEAETTNVPKRKLAVKTGKPDREPVPDRMEKVADDKADTPIVEQSQAEAQDEIASAKKPSAAAVPMEKSIVKEPDSIFDEVIVVGSGRANKKDVRSRTVSAGRAEKSVTPENGWDKFRQYVEDSARISTADSVLTGEEHVSFTIGDDGLPESIKILRSISPSHDREAIRLLQNGPPWKLIKGKKREIRLKIIF